MSELPSINSLNGGLTNQGPTRYDRPIWLPTLSREPPRERLRMYVGHKLKPEKVARVGAKLAAHLEQGESIVGMVMCNNMRPMVSRLVITDKRLLAIDVQIGSDPTPKWSCAHALVRDVVSLPEKKTFAVHTADGREQVFKMVQAEDHEALLSLLSQYGAYEFAGTGVDRSEVSTPLQQAAIDQGFPTKHRGLVEPLLGLLDAAAAAAERGDMVAEERAIWDGQRLAETAGLVAVQAPKWVSARLVERAEKAGILTINAERWLDTGKVDRAKSLGLLSISASEWFEARIIERAQRGEIRKGVDLLGVVGSNLTIMSDRVVQGESAYPIDADVKATVEVDGQILQQSRPTLTRMAFGSVLPGSALLVGLAAPKTTTTDMRSAQFVVVHPKWRIVERLDPNGASQLTGLAAQITAIAVSLQRSGSATAAVTATSSSSLETVADEIAKLAALHDAGALTDDEFVAAKRRLLG